MGPGDEALEPFDGRRRRRDEPRHLFGRQHREQRLRVARPQLPEHDVVTGEHRQTLLPIGSSDIRYWRADDDVHVEIRLVRHLFHYRIPPTGFVVITVEEMSVLGTGSMKLVSPNSTATLGSGCCSPSPTNSVASSEALPHVTSVSALVPHTTLQSVDVPHRTFSPASAVPQTTFKRSAVPHTTFSQSAPPQSVP